MVDTALDIIKALQKRLEEEGFTLYSLKHQNPQPTLIMYHTERKKFTVVSFSPDAPGDYSKVDMWLTIAESKAEIFGKLEVAPYRVYKDAQQKWNTTNDEFTRILTDA